MEERTRMQAHHRMLVDGKMRLGRTRRRRQLLLTRRRRLGLPAQPARPRLALRDALE